MPDRVARASIIGSEKLAQVSDQAALLYDRLILIADDFGLVDMSPVSLRLRAVPGRDSFTLERVAQCCLELARVGLIRPYDSDGKQLGAIQKWDQTRWAKKPKLPMPPWGEEHITGGHIALRAREPAKEAPKQAQQPRANGDGRKHQEPLELPPWLDVEAWNGYVAKRKANSRDPDQLRACLKKLEKWRAAGHDANAIVQYSFENGYQGLVEPKVKPKTQPDFPL